MTGALCNHLAFDPTPGQRQVPNQVQHLVPHKLIIEAQRPILHTLARKNDRALIRHPADQPHVPQHRLVFLKPEGPRRSNQLRIVARSPGHRETSPPNRLRKVDRVVDPITLPRIHPNKLRSPSRTSTSFRMLQVLAPAPLLLQPVCLERLAHTAAQLPSRIGTSRLSISTMTLSTPYPISATADAPSSRSAPSPRIRLVA